MVKRIEQMGRETVDVTQLIKGGANKQGTRRKKCFPFESEALRPRVLLENK